MSFPRPGGISSVSRPARDLQVAETQIHRRRRTAMGLRGGRFLCLGFWLIMSMTLGAHNPAGAPPEAAFKAGVKLVQVSVVAQDKQGKPVTDLRREECQIFDNGSPQ